MLGLDTLFHKLLFGIIATVANIVDVLIDFIRMILGLSPLEGTDGVVNLLQDNLWTEVVLQAFGVIVALAVIISFAFALVRLVRANIADKDEGGHWKASRGLIESLVLMFIIPLFAGVIILAVSVTAQAIDTATRDTQGANISYSTEVVFSTVDKDMLTGEGSKWFLGEQNGYTIYDGYGNQVTGMTAVKLIYGGWTNGVEAEDKYYSDAQRSVVLEPPLAGWSDFDRLTHLASEGAYFDTFILPMLGGFVMLCALAMASITITQRIFSVIFLFIIAPIPASVRPLDDGARYKKWSEIFLGKVLGGYGIIFALNVFFSLCPLIVSQTFFYDAFANGVAKLIVYIAGVVFATGANVLIGQLIGADAGMAERDQTTQNFRSAMSGAYWTGSAVRGVRRLAGYPFGRSKSARRSSLSGMGGSAGVGKTPGGTDAALTAGAGEAGGTQSVSARIGGAMGAMGAAFAKGHAGEGLKSAAKGAGNRIASTRIAKAAVGTAMFVGGLAAGGVRAARAGWYRGAGKNTYGGLTYRARRALEKYKAATPEARANLRPQLRALLAKRTQAKKQLVQKQALAADNAGKKQADRSLSADVRKPSGPSKK